MNIFQLEPTLLQHGLHAHQCVVLGLIPLRGDQPQVREHARKPQPSEPTRFPGQCIRRFPGYIKAQAMEAGVHGQLSPKRLPGRGSDGLRLPDTCQGSQGQRQLRLDARRQHDLLGQTHDQYFPPDACPAQFDALPGTAHGKALAARLL